MPDVFLQWNVEDPVSEYETQRNTVLEAMQGNRNPFIDNPYLATKIWGGNPAQETWGLLNVDENELREIKLYPIPVKDRLYVSNATSSNFIAVIYNVKGQELKIPINNNYFNVELLTEGVYILRITQGDKMSTFKFIKE